jgi:signal transduction histidine kinase
VRPPLLLAVCAVGGCAVAAVAVALDPLAGSLGAAGLGLAVGVGARLVGACRVDRVTAFLRGAVEGEPPPRLGGTAEGRDPWRRLARAAGELTDELAERGDELASERARVERLLDNLPVALLLFTGRGLSYANPAAQAVFEVGREARRTPLQVLGVEALAEAVTEAAEARRSVEVEVGRHERQLLANASVTAAGEVALVVTDLTESRRVEAMRRDFVANASHELKTPVAGIQALADSLKLAVGRDPDRAERMLERMEHEAGRLAQLVRELLDLSRLEETQPRLRRERVDLAAIATEQVQRLGRLAESRGVKLRTDRDDPAPLVGVPEDLRLIVANVVENAVRYTGEDGEVVVSVGRTAGQVRLEVVDDGVGIAEADKDRIFERFYRVDKARSREAGGTGLGLSLVRHAVERQGGSVSVDSVLGEGSRFRVDLPVGGAS